MSVVEVVRAPMGLGKTTEVSLALRDGNERVEWYVPNHALAEELRRVIQRNAPLRSVGVIAGRGHLDTDGHPLCRKSTQAEEIARAGGEVYRSLCKRTLKRKGQSVVETCEYFADCPYLAQFGKAEITIYPHAYLPLSRMTLEGDPPDYAVIDESFWGSCIEIVKIPLSDLLSTNLPALTRQILGVAAMALVSQQPLIASLLARGFRWDSLRSARQALKRTAKITPATPEQQWQPQLPGLKQVSTLQKLLKVINSEIVYSERESQAITFDSQTQLIHLHIKRRITRFKERTRGSKIVPGSRVLIIDGSANEQLILRWFRISQFHTILADRLAKVIQCSSNRCSTSSLLEHKHANPDSASDAKKKLQEVQTFINRLSDVHCNVLVVGPQAITGNPAKGVPAVLQPPANVELAHFNAIRGCDRWKNFDAVVIVGRNQPPIKEVEALARCIHHINLGALNFAPDWVAEERGYQYRREKLGTTVVVHPDSRIQAVLEQLRERESEQAIDRLRLIHASTNKTVYILSNIPLDIDVDELVSWKALMNESRLERAWSAMDGVMPLESKWLADQFPALWRSPAAAKADAARHLKELQTSNNISIRNLPLFVHSYRPVASSGAGGGQRSWSVFVAADADPRIAKAQLELLLSCQVVVRVRAHASKAEPLVPRSKPQRTARLASRARSARSSGPTPHLTAPRAARSSASPRC